MVKPAVGAGSRDAASYRADQHETAVAHVARLHASGQVVLVQPFLKSVATDGEWPLVFFDGRFSHAASKRVALPQAGAIDDLFAAETNAEHVATAAQIDVAQAAVDLVSGRLGTPAYARVVWSAMTPATSACSRSNWSSHRYFCPIPTPPPRNGLPRSWSVSFDQLLTSTPHTEQVSTRWLVASVALLAVLHSLDVPFGELLGEGDLLDCDRTAIGQARVHAVKGVDLAVAIVVKGGPAHGLYVAEGLPQSSWARAAEESDGLRRQRVKRAAKDPGQGPSWQRH